MKKIVRIVAIFVALIVGAAVAIPFLVDVNQFRPRLQTELSTALGRRVTIGDLKLSILSGSVAAADLSIADDPGFSKSPFLQAKSLSAGVELFPLIFSRKVSITKIVIDEPEIMLLQRPTGEWNYAKLGSSSPAPKTEPAPAPSSAPVDLSVKLVKINNGRITIAKTSGHAKPLVLDKVNLELNDFSRTSVIPFSLSAKLAGGGDIKIGGKGGPISAENVELTPINLTLKATHLDLVASGAIEAAAGIAGIVAVDATGDSNGKRIELKGKIQAEQLRLVKGASPATKTVAFDFSLHHDLATRAGSLVQGDVHIGRADAKLTGVYTPHGESMTLKANLHGPNLPAPELEGMLPALNVVLPAGAKLEGGTVSVSMSVEGPVADLTSVGSVALNNVRLSGFDMGKKLTVIESLAGIKNTPTTQIETLSSDLKNNDQGTALDNMKLVVTDIGELTGSGTVSPARALDFKMRVSVKGGILPAALGARAQSGIPFFVRGTAADPKFEPDIKGMAAAEVQDLKSSATKAATGILGGLLGKKKN
jgi:AsmA protein